MKRSFLILIAFLCLINVTRAQCTLTKTTIGATIKVETNEGYFYIRQATSYHAVALKGVKLTGTTGSKTSLQIKFTTTSSTFKPQLMHIKFADGSMIMDVLKFKKKGKTDKKEFIENTYEIALSVDDLNRLSLLPIQSIALSSKIKVNSIEIPVSDGSLFQQQIICLKN